jgi:hypothetical protein
MNIHQQVILAVRKRRRPTWHGFHSLRRVSFEQNSRVEVCRIRRECVVGLEGSCYSLGIVGLNADWEHHVNGVMLSTHSIVYSSSVDDGESGIVCYVLRRYSWTDG